MCSYLQNRIYIYDKIPKMKENVKINCVKFPKNKNLILYNMMLSNDTNIL